MRFSYFSSVKSQHSKLLTADEFSQLTADPMVEQLCRAIACETDHNKQQQLKKQLEVIT